MSYQGIVSVTRKTENLNFLLFRGDRVAFISDNIEKFPSYLNTNSLQAEDVIISRRAKYYSAKGSQCKRFCVLSVDVVNVKTSVIFCEVCEDERNRESRQTKEQKTDTRPPILRPGE